MHAGIVGFGSRGDLYPLWEIADGLTRRGHTVTVFEYDEHREEVETLGIDFVSLGAASPWAPRFSSHRHLFGHQRALAIRSVVFADVRSTLDRILSQPCGFDAIYAPQFQYAAQLACELLDIPLVSVIPVDSANALGGGTTASDAWTSMDGVFTRKLNRIRRDLGLAPRELAGTFGSVSQTAVMVFGSSVFAKSVERWPAAFRLAGPSSYDGGAYERVSNDVQSFAAREELGPLVVCTLGDSWGTRFPPPCEHLARLADRGIRVLYLVGRGGIEVEGSERTLVAGWAPLSRILPSAAAIMHHAGLGTLTASLRFGRPSIMLPFWQDQPANAARAAELGAGVVVRGDATADDMADAVDAVLFDPRYLGAARAVAALIAQDPDISEVADDCLYQAAAASDRPT